MKKLTALLLAIVMVAALAACGGPSATTASPTPDAQTTEFLYRSEKYKAAPI